MLQDAQPIRIRVLQQLALWSSKGFCANLCRKFHTIIRAERAKCRTSEWICNSHAGSISFVPQCIMVVMRIHPADFVPLLKQYLVLFGADYSYTYYKLKCTKQTDRCFLKWMLHLFTCVKSSHLQRHRRINIGEKPYDDDDAYVRNLCKKTFAQSIDF